MKNGENKNYGLGNSDEYISNSGSNWLWLIHVRIDCCGCSINSTKVPSSCFIGCVTSLYPCLCVFAEKFHPPVLYAFVTSLCFDFRVVFVDAGVTQIDIETKKMKEEQKLREAQSRAVAEHGELALITVEGPQSTTEERISLRPPMLQVKIRFQFYQIWK
jgi:hypothetical protein